MLNKKIITFNYSEYEVSKINPRFITPAEDEKSAIIRLIDMDMDKMKALVKSISQGWNNCFFIFAVKENKFILMDGNRRLAALKIIINQAIIPSDSKYDNLRELCKLVDTKYVNSITLYGEVYPNISDELLNYLERIHIGEDSTRSEWGYVAQYYLGIQLGVSRHQHIKTLLHYMIPHKIDAMLKGTNDIYKRAYTSRKCKEFLKIDSEGKINLDNPKKVVKTIEQLVKSKAFDTRTKIDLIPEIINDELKKKSDVKCVDTSNISISEEEYPNNNIAPSNKTSVENDSLSQFNTGRMVPKSQIASSLRNTVFPNELSIQKTEFSKIDELFDKLRTLPINTNINTLAILFRSFLQFTVKIYSKLHPDKNIKVDDDLFGSGLKVTNDCLFALNIGTYSDAGIHSQISQVIKKTNANQQFNGIVHDLETTIDKQTLIDWGNCFAPLIRRVYNELANNTDKKLF